MVKNKRARMTVRQAATRSLRAEIEELERKLSGCDYMDEEPVVEEMDWMDDDDIDDMDDMVVEEDIDVVDDSLLEDEEPELVDEIIEEGCGGLMASEVDPNGVEERISQDYLDAVEEVAHGTELATAPSISKVAPTRSKYASRLKSASARLDKVAEYLEKNGRKDLALRIDKIADVVDERIKKMRRM